MSADTPLVLGVRSLARLAGVPRSRVRAAMDDGRLVTVATDALRGRVCRYVLVSGEGAPHLDAWASLHAEPLYLDEVDAPRTNGGFPWFYPAEVRRVAASPGAPFRLVRDRVAEPGPFLRWAATQMPAGERRAIAAGLLQDAA